MQQDFEPESLKKQNIIGFFVIPEHNKQKEFYCTLEYDPINGVSELILFDFETDSGKKYCYALGRTVSG